MSSYEEQTTLCTSPDARNFNESGTVEFLNVGDSGIQSTQSDYCNYFIDGRSSEQGHLVQTFCDGTRKITEEINCGIGSSCRQGRCVKGTAEPICVDSDGGKNLKERGSVEGIGLGTDECYVSTDSVNPENSGSLTDKCSGAGCYVYEYFCNGAVSGYELIPSPKGCENGAGK